eukprot:gene17105-23404_t
MAQTDEATSAEAQLQEQQTCGKGLMRNRSSNRRFHNKNLKYLQAMENKKKIQGEQEQAEKEREQRLRNSLARKVLGESRPNLRLSKDGEEGAAPAAALYGSKKEVLEQQTAALLKLYGNGPGQLGYVQWRIRNKIPDCDRVFVMGGTGNHSLGIKQGLLERGWCENSDHCSPHFDLKVYSSLASMKTQDHCSPHFYLKVYSSLASMKTQDHCSPHFYLNGLLERGWCENSDHCSPPLRPQGLLERGWCENSDHCSPHFDLKWAVAASDINKETLWHSQIVNHFGKATCITTKVGLCRTLRELAWYEAADYRDFYPRGFDLSNDEEVGHFMTEARLTSAEAIATAWEPLRVGLPLGEKRCHCMGALEGGPGATAWEPLRVDPTWVEERQFITSQKIPRGRRRKNGGAADKDGEEEGEDGNVGPKGSDDSSAPEGGAADKEGEEEGKDGNLGPKGNDDSSAPEGGAAAEDGDQGRQPGSAGVTDPTPSVVPEPSSCDSEEERGGQQVDLAGGPGSTGSKESSTMDQAPQVAAAEDLLTEDMLPKLSALMSSDVQTHINGMNNVWIAKPAGKSRGRGIRLFNNIEELMGYVKSDEQQSLEGRWVVQKYVERPLLVRARKFDIPADCYLRFAAEEYDTNNLDVFNHLTNNSIAKNFEGDKQDEISAAGNMWTVDTFKDWLGETYGDPSLWESLIAPAMKHIVICTSKYDFLIDDQLRVWLLEVNSSPTMEASTPITQRLCASVQEDILKPLVPSCYLSAPEQQRAKLVALELRDQRDRERENKSKDFKDLKSVQSNAAAIARQAYMLARSQPHGGMPPGVLYDAAAVQSELAKYISDRGGEKQASGSGGGGLFSKGRGSGSGVHEVKQGGEGGEGGAEPPPCPPSLSPQASRPIGLKLQRPEHSLAITTPHLSAPCPLIVHPCEHPSPARASGGTSPLLATTSRPTQAPPLLSISTPRDPSRGQQRASSTALTTSSSVTMPINSTAGAAAAAAAAGPPPALTHSASLPSAPLSFMERVRRSSQVPTTSQQVQSEVFAASARIVRAMSSKGGGPSPPNPNPLAGCQLFCSGDTSRAAELARVKDEENKSVVGSILRCSTSRIRDRGKGFSNILLRASVLEGQADCGFAQSRSQDKVPVAVVGSNSGKISISGRI